MESVSWPSVGCRIYSVQLAQEHGVTQREQIQTKKRAQEEECVPTNTLSQTFYSELHFSKENSMFFQAEP